MELVRVDKVTVEHLDRLTYRRPHRQTVRALRRAGNDCFHRFTATCYFELAALVESGQLARAAHIARWLLGRDWAGALPAFWYLGDWAEYTRTGMWLAYSSRRRQFVRADSVEGIKALIRGA